MEHLKESMEWPGAKVTPAHRHNGCTGRLPDSLVYTMGVASRLCNDNPYTVTQ